MNPDEVQLLGRVWPRATKSERAAWGIIGLGLICVLALAAWLTPDPAGVGTHRQIPFLGPGHSIPPCGFLEVTGIPCPSCGYTTTFALAMHAQFWTAIKNQPMGFLVWIGFCTMLPVSLASALGGVSPLRATDHWRWKWLLVGFVSLWLLGWIYKIGMLRA
jgi:hypothetical protein